MVTPTPSVPEIVDIVLLMCLLNLGVCTLEVGHCHRKPSRSGASPRPFHQTGRWCGHRDHPRWATHSQRPNRKGQLWEPTDGCRRKCSGTTQCCEIRRSNKFAVQMIAINQYINWMARHTTAQQNIPDPNNAAAPYNWPPIQHANRNVEGMFLLH